MKILTVIFVSNIHTKESVITNFIRLPDLFPDKYCQGFPSRILTYFWKISSSTLNLLTFMEDMVGVIILELLKTGDSKTNTDKQHTDKYDPL